MADSDQRLSHLIRSAGFRDWRAKVQATGGCAKPVRLAGAWAAQDAAGVRHGETEGSIFTACGNRRASVCPACAARYAADTFHLVRSGLTGGKGVPETVTEHVRVFATLTAPSFGPVHGRPVTRSGRPRPCSCGEWHSEHDSRLGSPADPSTYDYVGAVLWQAHSTELWRRFTITVGRTLAAALGIPPADLKDHLRVSYAKVAEYQRRGLVHFHAVIRIDGPDGPDTLPPAAVTAELLTVAIRYAARSVEVSTPDNPEIGVRTLGWGDQVDVEPIEAGTSDDPEQRVRDARVAGYIAKYATKDTGVTTGADTRIRSAEHIESLTVSEHHRQMMRTCWRLGGVPELAGLKLRSWAHMLGFRGHFLTKSRRYSITFSAIRQTRAEHRLAAHLAELGIEDTDTVTVINDWSMTGVGYRSDAEREYAAVIAETQRQRPSTRADQRLLAVA
ncbi:MAG TPA: replication initiator [Pseudonocardiaceae bacterium]|nr:replication initiator [Pseudonocardiaceae bacterium]